MSPLQVLAYQYVKHNPGKTVIEISNFIGANYGYTRNIMVILKSKGFVVNKSKTRAIPASYHALKREKDVT